MQFVALLVLHASAGALVFADDRQPTAADVVCVYAYVPETGRNEIVCGARTGRPAGQGRAVPEGKGHGQTDACDDRPAALVLEKPVMTYCDVCRPRPANSPRLQPASPAKTACLLGTVTGCGAGVHGTARAGFDDGPRANRRPDFVLWPAIEHRPRIADVTRFHDGYKAPADSRTFDVIKPNGRVIPGLYKTHGLGVGDPADRQYNAAMIQLQMFNGLPRNAEGRTALFNNPLQNVGQGGLVQFVISEIGHDMFNLIKNFGVIL